LTNTIPYNQPQGGNANTIPFNQPQGGNVNTNTIPFHQASVNSIPLNRLQAPTSKPGLSNIKNINLFQISVIAVIDFKKILYLSMFNTEHKVFLIHIFLVNLFVTKKRIKSQKSLLFVMFRIGELFPGFGWLGSSHRLEPVSVRLQPQL
jgi:hypothetical protein